MTTQDLDGVPRYTHEPDPSAALMKYIKEIESRLQVMERTAPKNFSITGPDGAKLSFDPIRMAGFNAAGDEVFRLSTADGTATFNGAVKIGGTLDLPAGIINNAALSSPITGRAGSASANGFTVPAVTETEIAAFAFTVPDGYTKVDIIALGSVFVYNPGGAIDYVYARVYVGTGWGHRLVSLIGSSGGSVALTPNDTEHFEGLTGGQIINVSLRMKTDTNAITHSSNSCSVNALATFTR